MGRNGTIWYLDGTAAPGAALPPFSVVRLGGLKALRERRMLSLAELAELTGVSKSTLQRAEQGAVSPHPRTIRRIAEALGVTVEQLTAGRNTPPAAR